MKGFWKDFKAFISKGNILDLAVGVVVGGAFGKITSSLVNDIIMPLISAATGGVSVSDWKWVITAADPAKGIAESALYYGNFIQTILDFLIISFFIFLTIRIIIKSREKLSKVGTTLKTDIKRFGKKKKNKQESVEIVQIEEPQTNPVVADDNSALAPEAVGLSSSENIVTAEKSESNKNEIIETITKVSEASTKYSAKQEELLTQIRDLLQKQTENLK